MCSVKEACRCLVFTLLVFLAGFRCFADGLPNENVCYDPSIKTIQVFKEGFELSSPIIELNSTDRISIQFDDLDPDIKRYKFTVVHCESDWTTSSDLSVASRAHLSTEYTVQLELADAVSWF